MKKIIWLFGQPAAGRKTLIRNVMMYNKDVLKTLDLDCKNIHVLELPFDREYLPTNYHAIDNRREKIKAGIKEFSEDDNDILMIYGEHPDFAYETISLLIKVAEVYPDIEREIYYLVPSDLKVLHERIKNTDWFKSNEKDNNYRYQFDWLTFAVDYYRKHLSEYEEYGYKFTEIDTLHGYEINKPKTLTLKQD